MEELLTSLLAPVAAGRRYWVRAPQGTALPNIVLNRVTGTRGYTMQGADRLVQSRVQVDCYGESYTSAKTVARAVRDIVSGYAGGIIQGIFVDSERDLTAEDAGPVHYQFRVSIDLMIHHLEN